MLQWVLSGGRCATQPWSPHAATIVIGLAFVTLLLLAGARACTYVLADLARGKAGSLPAQVLLALALLWPCAWASFGPMCAAVAVGLGVSSRLRRDARRRDARYGSSKLNVTVPLIAAAASKLRSLTCTTRRPACRSTTTSVEQRVP